MAETFYLKICVRSESVGNATIADTKPLWRKALGKFDVVKCETGYITVLKERESRMKQQELRGLCAA